MKRLTIIALAALAIAAQNATAQWNVARFESGQNRVYTTYGLDPAFVAAIGYGRVVSVARHPFQLTGELGVVAAHLDARDYRARVSTQTSLVSLGPLRFTGSATAIARGTENSIYRAVNYGADLTGALGVYHPRWFVAGDYGKDKAIVTRIKNSEWYRQYVYPDAKDGWYLTGGGTYHYGLSGGISVGAAEIAARVGFLRTERFHDMLPPAYASLGVGFGF